MESENGAGARAGAALDELALAVEHKLSDRIRLAQQALAGAWKEAGRIAEAFALSPTREHHALYTGLRRNDKDFDCGHDDDVQVISGGRRARITRWKALETIEVEGREVPHYVWSCAKCEAEQRPFVNVSPFNPPGYGPPEVLAEGAPNA